MKTLSKKYRATLIDGTASEGWTEPCTGFTFAPDDVPCFEADTLQELQQLAAAAGVELVESGSIAEQPTPSIEDYKRIIDEYIEGVATSQEYDDATSFRSRAGYENAFQSAAIAFGQWSDAIYVWSSQQRENPPSTPPSLDEFRALLVSEFPIPDLAVMAPKKTSVLAWFRSWFS